MFMVFSVKVVFVSIEHKLLVQRESHIDYHLKSHDMIYATTDLNPRMMDICALMLTEMQAEDWFNEHGEEVTPEYEFDSTRLSEWFNKQKKDLYSALDNPSNQLAKKTIGISNNGEFEYYPILSKITYKQGVLTIKPNGDLRNKYITNISQNGHAKIDNTVFRALNNANHKKVFEFLCRFRDEYEMYPMSIKKVQTIFGVFDGKGKAIKTSYVKPSVFIDKVIAPSLLAISKLSGIEHKFEIPESKDGVGFELDTSGREPKIRFLVNWKKKLTHKEAEQLARRASDLSSKYLLLKESGACALDVMVELEQVLRSIGYDTQADSFAKMIKAEIEKLEEKKRAEKEAEAMKEFINLDLMLKRIHLD